MRVRRVLGERRWCVVNESAVVRVVQTLIQEVNEIVRSRENITAVLLEMASIRAAFTGSSRSAEELSVSDKRAALREGVARETLNPNSEVEMGSARAARAVFRALAENAERTEKFQTFGKMSCAKRLDARRVRLGFRLGGRIRQSDPHGV